MNFEDRSLTCIDCGLSFIFSAIDQEYFRSRDYPYDPQRCSSCREANQSQGKGSTACKVKRETFYAACMRCGKNIEFHCEPPKNSPVYCKECYSKNQVTG